MLTKSEVSGAPSVVTAKRKHRLTQWISYVTVCAEKPMWMGFMFLCKQTKTFWFGSLKSEITYVWCFRDYLQAESLDKKKQPFDMSDWNFEIAKVIRYLKMLELDQ